MPQPKDDQRSRTAKTGCNIISSRPNWKQVQRTSSAPKLNLRDNCPCGSTSPSAHDCLPHFLIRALPNELLAHNSQSQSLFIGNSTYITQQLWSTFPYFWLFHWTCSLFTASILPKSRNHISSPSWISFIFLTV